eukprot:359589-Chlamydomonas_euryale.AAC.7
MREARACWVARFGRAGWVCRHAAALSQTLDMGAALTCKRQPLPVHLDCGARKAQPPRRPVLHHHTTAHL